MRFDKVIKNIFRLAWQRPKGTRDFFLSWLSYRMRMYRVLGRPVNAVIELTNLCDLKCPVCETGAGILKREKGMMCMEDYKAIIDKISGFTNTALLYYMGEPFLNKEIYRMIRYAKNKKIFVKVCTNGQNVDAGRLLDSCPDEVQFQIGGISGDTHSTYRINADLNKTLKNLKSLVKERAERADRGILAATRIYLGLIVMKHNEDEVDDFFKLAKQIGVDGARIEAPCVRNIEQGFSFLPANQRYWLYDRPAFNNGALKHKDYRPGRCRGVYYFMTIAWNGDVFSCCRDVEGAYTMGNLLKEGPAQIWNGGRFLGFRKKILSDPGSIQMCFLCDGLSLPSLEKGNFLIEG